MIRINDKSRDGIYSSNMELIDNFTDYSSKNLDFDKPVEIDFIDDEENAKNPLGSTAYYNPDEMKITIYVTGRHLKDILRSISHELIHHVQNCRGDLDHKPNKLGYAQDDKHMRGMEHEAYTMGNIMNFRDFEDNYKITGANKMSTKNKLGKLKEIIKKGVEEVINEEVSEDERKQRAGEYKNVAYRKIPGSRTFGRVGLRRDAVIQIADCRSPKSVGRYIKDQVESSYVNDNELLLLTLGVESCKKKRKLGGILAYLKLDDTGPLFDYIRKNISMGGPTSSALRNRIFNALKDSVKGASPAGPAAAGGMSSGGGCVDKCPQGSAGETNQEYPGGVCKKDGRIVAVLNGQGNEAKCKKLAGGGASPAGGRRRSGGGRRTYKNCDNEKVIKIRCTGKKVKLIQQLLGISDDGKFWTGTRRAVKKFQRENNLTPDGAVGDKTFAALKARGGAAKKPGATPAGGAAQAAQAGQAAKAGQAGATTQAAKKSTAVISPIKSMIQQILGNKNKAYVNAITMQYLPKELGKLNKLSKDMTEDEKRQAAQAAVAAYKRDFPKALKEGIEINFDEFTKTLNEHKNNKLDDRFKKLVKAFKK